MHINTALSTRHKTWWSQHAGCAFCIYMQDKGCKWMLHFRIHRIFILLYCRVLVAGIFFVELQHKWYLSDADRRLPTHSVQLSKQNPQNLSYDGAGVAFQVLVQTEAKTKDFVFDRGIRHGLGYIEVDTARFYARCLLGRDKSIAIVTGSVLFHPVSLVIPSSQDQTTRHTAYNSVPTFVIFSIFIRKPS